MDNDMQGQPSTEDKSGALSPEAVLLALRKTESKFSNPRSERQNDIAKRTSAIFLSTPSPTPTPTPSPSPGTDTAKPNEFSFFRSSSSAPLCFIRGPSLTLSLDATIPNSSLGNNTLHPFFTFENEEKKSTHDINKSEASLTKNSAQHLTRATTVSGRRPAAAGWRPTSLIFNASRQNAVHPDPMVEPRVTELLSFSTKLPETLAQLSQPSTSTVETLADKFFKTHHCVGPRPLLSTATQVASKAWLLGRRSHENQVIHIHSHVSSQPDMVADLALEQLLSLGVSTSTHQTFAIQMRRKVLSASVLLDLLGAVPLHPCEETLFGKDAALPVMNSFCFKSSLQRCYALHSEVLYDSNGGLLGAHFSTFHFDASSCSSRNSFTPTFPVFYALCAGCGTLKNVQELKACKLSSDTSKYAILSHHAAPKNRDLAQKFVSAQVFQLLFQCFSTIGFSRSHIFALFEVLAALIHIGNIEFVSANRKKEECAVIKNEDSLNTAAELLGIPSSSLLALLTARTHYKVRANGTLGDRFSELLSPADAIIERDHLVCQLYTDVFQYFSEAICHWLAPSSVAQPVIYAVSVLNVGGIITSKLASSTHQQFLSDSTIFARNVAADRLMRLAIDTQMAAMQKSYITRRSGTRSPPSSVAASPSKINDKPAARDLEAQGNINEENAPELLATLRGLDQICIAQERFYNTVESTSPTAIHSELEKKDAIHEIIKQCSDYSIEVIGPAPTMYAKLQHSLGKMEYPVAAFVPRLNTSMHTYMREILVPSSKKARRKVNMLLPRIYHQTRFKTVNSAFCQSKYVPCFPPARFEPAMGAYCDPFLGFEQIIYNAMVPKPAKDTEEEGLFELKKKEHLGSKAALISSKEVSRNSVPGSKSKVALMQEQTDEVFKHVAGRRIWTLMLLPSAESLTKTEIIACGLPFYLNGDCSLVLCCAESNFAGLFPAPAPPLSALSQMCAKTLEGFNVVLMAEKEWLALEACCSAMLPSSPLSETSSTSKAGDTSLTHVDLKSDTGRLNELIDEGLQALIPKATPEELAVARKREEYDLSAPHGSVKAKKDKKFKIKKDYGPKKSMQRRVWLCCVWSLTWWIPEACIKCCKMPRDDVRLTWREKVTLCIFIALLSAVMLFFIAGLTPLMCPTIKIFTTQDLQKANDAASRPLMQYIINGYIYDLSQYTHPAGNPGFSVNGLEKISANDVSAMFPRWNPVNGWYPSVCSSTAPRAKTLTMADSLCIAPAWTAKASNLGSGAFCHNYTTFLRDVELNIIQVAKVGTLAWTVDEISLHTKSNSSLIYIGSDVYDVTDLINSPFSPIASDSSQLSAITGYLGRDASAISNIINIPCLQAIAYVGTIDNRNSAACTAGMYILMAVTYIMVAVMVIKFLAALRFGTSRVPEGIDKYVIMQVPCYSEGVDSLKKTVDSLALTTYDDRRKLLFVVADGMVKGAGNEKSTPDLLLELFNVKGSAREAQPFSYVAIGEGSKQHNRAKVYSGLYSVQGRSVPYVIVVKCGTEKEITKAGNRGKRDSQMILMKFINKVLTGAPLVPLELELYKQIRNKIGVPPSNYEYALMVDADTEVGPDCLTRLISSCVHDARIMGLCGETKIANEKDSWITMIQVYEYYISHHLAKAFESLFGSVTCLPGCFCMYRLFSTNTDGTKTPLVVAPEIIKEYSECHVDTLHKKNLLSLGEDRYLTTLLLKYFPQYKTKFKPDSYCLTIVPTSFSVLLSQRRRWINSTIHNLFELLAVKDLCGCLFFSMRMIVFLDLFATLAMPASVAYLIYLIYFLAINPTDQRMQVLILIGVTYGLQALIYLFNRQWQHIGWMFIHILAMPVFYMYIPLYSFWHFDDFSWGNTRVIAGESGKGGHDGDDEKFDPNSLVSVTWEDYKKSQSLLASKKHHAGSSQNLTSSSSALLTASPRSTTKRSPERAANTRSMASMSDLINRTPSANSLRASLGNEIALADFKSGMPSDAEIRDAVKIHLQEADLRHTTKRTVRAALARQFGVDMSGKRGIINDAVTEFLERYYENTDTAEPADKEKLEKAGSKENLGSINDLASPFQGPSA